VNLRRVAELAPRGGAMVLVMQDAARSEVQVSERRAAAVRAILRGR
jgi:DNA-binding LytR/AlgR family response regulator